ncbi:MAG TPA: phage virion morphogenesis protein [Terriglobia bacterium]|nr:phage virion morphogenesis protein [Terriglobia bacterium]
MIAFSGFANSEAAENSLDLLQAQLSDLSPAMELIAEDIREMEAEQFASSGATGDTPWAALAPSTEKRRHGAGHCAAGS